MPKRPAALSVFAALLSCIVLACACAPATAPAPARVSQQPPDGPGRRVALAAFHLRDERGGGPLEALEVLDAPEAAGEAARDEAGMLALRALAYRQLGRNAEAVAALDRLMLSRRDLPPGALADAFVERGLALAGLGHQARAAEDYEAALALDPRHVPALMARADQLFALEQPAEAEAWYSRIIALDPANALAHINRGVARDEQGRFAEAIADFTRALALDPGSPAAYVNRGVSRSQAGDMAGMCADYQAACRLGACHRLGEAQAMGYCQGQ
jgi:tetratricopeptide (TPR) repeat protein